MFSLIKTFSRACEHLLNLVQFIEICFYYVYAVTVWHDRIKDSLNRSECSAKLDFLVGKFVSDLLDGLTNQMCCRQRRCSGSRLWIIQRTTGLFAHYSVKHGQFRLPKISNELTKSVFTSGKVLKFAVVEAKRSIWHRKSMIMILQLMMVSLLISTCTILVLLL